MKQLVELPARWRIDCPVRRIARPLSSLDEAIAAALARPISSLPLDMICRPGNRVTLVCADPNYEPDELNRAFVPALLRELKSAGVYDEDITILSATGLRRPSSPTEIHARLGDEVAQHYPIFSHNAHDAREQDDLGVYEHVPVRVNYHAVEADVLIATGIVQPHLYAGYTGGSKIVAVGCADAATIHELYSPRFLDDPSVRAGNIEGNACQRAIR
ncbi:MAG: lactate racemase domain-containing protein, partial [Anaerolineae bacterium]|nr:lactate racemase domain-containing protein [Thermoflexales bacterium]MDW8408022.1 lactate racemase domain-containing protein [Anaerolineae bacterium]